MDTQKGRGTLVYQNELFSFLLLIELLKSSSFSLLLSKLVHNNTIKICFSKSKIMYDLEKSRKRESFAIFHPPIKSRRLNDVVVIRREVNNRRKSLKVHNSSMPFRKSTRANIEAQRECIYTYREGEGVRKARLEGKRALVKVPFGRDDKGREKARPRSSLNGTDEWLWKQHLICIEGERGLFVGSPWRAAAEERGEERNRRGNTGEGGRGARLSRPWLFSR